MQKQLQEASMVKGERNTESDKPNYSIFALPPDSDNFKNPDNWVEFSASWLKVNDIGFAASAFEFSEYQETITLEVGNGNINIVLPDN